MPFDTPQRFSRGIADLHALAEKAGRDPQSIDIGLIVQGPFEWQSARNNDGSARRLFTGTSQEMAADASALAEVGVGHVALRLGGDSITEAVDRIQRFGEEVIAKAK